MSDERDREPKRPTRGLFRLQSPRVRRGDMRVDEELSKLRQSLSETHHLCPYDGDAMVLDDVFETLPDGSIPDGAEPQRALVCPTCSYSIPIKDIKKKLKEDADALLKTSNQFVVFAVTTFVMLTAISFLNGNLLTFLGGAIMALILFLSAMFYRYRHWQADSGNVFMDKPPVTQWIREEILGRSTPQ